VPESPAAFEMPVARSLLIVSMTFAVFSNRARLGVVGIGRRRPAIERQAGVKNPVAERPR